MTRSNRTFRLFVSSTFADLEAERNVLQEKTFPRLQEYCRKKGASFQAIDLRWGVSSEASLDQQTMNICLGEILRCQEITPRPNFLVLLGQRYGWMPPQPQVPADVFERIISTIKDNDVLELLDLWYKADYNAVPPEYVLLPRDSEGPYTEHEDWKPIEEQLQQALSAGAKAIGLTGDDLLPFCTSATHQEIAAGALQVKNPENKVLCVFRQIEGFPVDAEGCPTNGAEEFVDAEQEPIEKTKRELTGLFPEDVEADPNLVITTSQWSSEEQKPTEDHLDALAEEVYQRLRAQIDRELDSPTEPGEPENYKIQPDKALDDDGRSHHAVAEGHLPHFVGRKNVLDRVAAYLDAPRGRPLVISGEGGTGKSALLSKIIERAQAAHPEAQLVYRFIGATPEASTGRGLLLGLARELCRRRGEDETEIPEDENKLAEHFRERMEAVDGPPLILVLDALDQLPEKDSGRNFAWLPFRELPAGVCVVMTTRPGEIEESLQRSRQAIIEPLGGMSREEGQALLKLWLEDAGRTLQPDSEQPDPAVPPPDQRKEVLEKFAASDCRPLYLRLAFEEARRWRSWEEPEILTMGVEGIIRDNLFARLSQKQHHGETLVARALGYLAASRYGLAEEELHAVLSGDAEVYASFLEKSHHLPPDLVACARRYRQEATGQPVGVQGTKDWLEEIREDSERLREALAELCGSKGPRLPAVILARLRADLEPYLTTRVVDANLLLDFYHRELGDVSRATLEAGKEETCHGGLARYFLSVADSEGDRTWKGERRGLAELPYHLTRSENWDQLIGDEEDPGSLCDLRFIEAKCATGLAYELAGDYNAALDALPELQEKREAESAARGKCVDYALALADYSRRRCTGENDFSLPAPPLACELSPGLNRDHSASSMESTRGNRLQRFSGFNLENGHIIAKHPNWTIPIAGSYGGSGLIHKQARVFFGRSGKDWLLRRIENSEPPIFPACRAVLRCQGSVFAVATNADFTRAISGDGDNTLRIWDLERGACRAALEGHSSWIYAVASNPDFTQAISGGRDKTLRIWDLRNEICQAVLEGHTGSILALAASSDFTRAITASNDTTLRIWDLERKECISVLEGHPNAVNTVAANADFTRAVSWCVDKTIRVWDLRSGDCLAVFEPDGFLFSIECCAANADLTRAITGNGDGSVWLWDLKRGACVSILKGHTGKVNAVAASADFTHAVSGSLDNSVRVWNLESRVCQAVLEVHTLQVNAVAVSADFTRAISGGGDQVCRVWDLENGAFRKMPEGHAGSVSAMAASADFSRAVSGGGLFDRTLQVWDLESRKFRPLARGHFLGVWAVAVNAECSLAISGGGDKAVRVWDLESAACLFVLEGHALAVFAVATSADFSLAISGGGDKTVRVWDLESAASLFVLEGHAGAVKAVATSSDFTRAVSGSADNTLRLWDLADGQCISVLEGHAGAVNAVATSSDFTRAVSGSADNTLRLWDLADGQCISVLEGHAGAVNAVATSSDFTRAVSGSADNTLRLWDLGCGECLAIYYAGSPVESLAADFVSGRVICGTADGKMHFLTLMRGNEIVRMDDHSEWSDAKS